MKHNIRKPQSPTTRERKVFIMANQIFMRVNEVAEELGVSVPYAYKLIRQMNEGTGENRLYHYLWPD